MEWTVVKNNRRDYTSCTAIDLYDYGFHHNSREFTDTWMAYHGSKDFRARTIINRELRQVRKYQKARRLYGSIYSKFGIQTRYLVQRTK